MIVELIAKNAGANQEERAYYPSPSKVGQCERALVYHAMGVKPDPFPDRALLVFEDGNWHEEIIKDHIRGTVYKLIEFKGKNQRVEIAEVNGRKISGEIDGLLIDPLEELYLLEIKSINHFGFERLVKAGAPEDSHKRQSNLYMHGLIKAGFSVRKSVIVYKNKNNAAMAEFVVEYDEALALADIQKFAGVEEMASKQIVPPRPYDRDVDWQCGYCRFEKTCYLNFDAEFQALTEDAEIEEPEIVEKFKYYLEVSGHASELDKQKDELNEEIQGLLKERGLRGGRAGEYVAKIAMRSRTFIDKDSIPPEMLPSVQKTKSFPVLTIRKKKEGGAK